MNVMPRLNRARPNFYMTSANPNVSLGIIDSSLYISPFALKDENNKRWMDFLASIPLE